MLVLVVAGYAIYTSFRHVTAALPPPGCQAGAGGQAITLDTDQAAIAATIAGVAARDRLPRQAVTIAYAAALQESKLQNLDYGDRDSVGIFQQRPSEGWGPAAELEDPVYATTKFFAALTQVPGYAKMAVYQAAQAVQHSADGSAYAQWSELAGQLSGYFTGQSPHGVSCWYTPAGQADLAGAMRRMAQAFGPPGRKAVVVAISVDRSAQKNKGSAAVLHVRRDAAWTVAGWLVAHAQAYGLSEVRYAGYEWKAANGSMGWQRGPATLTDTSGTSGSIVAG
ncbi:MAG: hypothetical protein ACRDOH_08360 [Streptosporangiaceae bacterium]